MKKALRQGGRADLNVYVLATQAALGWATFPWWYEQDTLAKYGFTFTACQASSLLLFPWARP